MIWFFGFQQERVLFAATNNLQKLKNFIFLDYDAFLYVNIIDDIDYKNNSFSVFFIVSL